MKLERLVLIIMIIALFTFDFLLLLSNRNKKLIIESYKSKIVKLMHYEREDLIRKKAFDSTVGKNHLLASLDDAEKLELKDKRIVIYVPQKACGICLEKLLNRYWDNYINKVSKHVIILYANPHLKNIYYIGEELVDYKQIEEHEFENDDLIPIFFIDNNQELLYLYLFDVDLLESFEPYLKSFCNILDNERDK